MNENNLGFNLGALYSYALIEFQNSLTALDSLEDELQKSVMALDAITSYHKKLNGLDDFVHGLLRDDFYVMKNNLFMMRKMIEKYDRKLKLFVNDSAQKKEEFETLKQQLIEKLSLKERYVDDLINKSETYIKNFNTLEV